MVNQIIVFENGGYIINGAIELINALEKSKLNVISDYTYIPPGNKQFRVIKDCNLLKF